MGGEKLEEKELRNQVGWSLQRNVSQQETPKDREAHGSCLHYWDVYVLLRLHSQSLRLVISQGHGVIRNIYHRGSYLPKESNTANFIKTIHPLKSQGRIRKFKPALILRKPQSTHKWNLSQLYFSLQGQGCPSCQQNNNDNR